MKPVAEEVVFAVRKPRNVFIETQHTGTAPIKKTWSYYKRTGSLWEDIDHIPPARLQHFLRPDLGIKAAQAINKRYEQEQALADVRAWSQALNRAKLRATFAERREARERFEESIGLQRPRTAKPDVHGTALAAKMSMVALPDSLVRQAFRSTDELRERSLSDARLHGPGFDTERVGLEGLAFPRYAYNPHQPFPKVGRYARNLGAERKLATAAAAAAPGGGSAFGTASLEGW